MISLPVTPGRATELVGAEDPTSDHLSRWPFRHIEIEIVTACDCRCHGCDRLSDVTKAPNMTVSQIELFVKESIALGWPWERVRILGGEPTLSNQFREICSLICDLRRTLPKMFIQVLTNGLGKLETHRDWMLDRGIDPHVEGKEKGVNPSWFWNTRWVAVDRDPNIGAIPPCGIFGVRGCGVALTRNGYFLDGAGASAAKVAGLDVGVMHLKDVTWDAMLDQAKVLCRICGQWNSANGPRVTKLVSETGPTTGPYWTEKIAAFNRGETPKLRVYGGNDGN